MFIQSLFNGVSLLLHWETYVAVFMYLTIAFLPIVSFAILSRRSSALAVSSGFLLMFIQPVFTAIGVFIATTTLYPIVFGGADAAWSLPWVLIMEEPVRVLIVLGVMILASIIVALIPLIGQSGSLGMFAMGAVTIAFLTIAISRSIPGHEIEAIELFPSVWISFGIFIVSAIVAWIGLMLAAAIVSIAFKKYEDIATAIMLPLGSVSGFIPIFVYGSWVAIKLGGAAG